MTQDTVDKWNKRYQDAHKTPLIAQVLRENSHLLPPRGDALDLACGLGGNALFLAEHGLRTYAWDLSEVAIDKLNAIAAARALALYGERRDVVIDPPPAQSFDIIVVSHFLERSLAPQLIAALRPDGLLFYQTFTRIRVHDAGPSNPDFLLADNELLHIFSALRIVVYREEGRIGDTALGFRNKAMLIGQKKQ